MKPRKHATEIHAWAEGAEIEHFNHGRWEADELPMWYPSFEYRIKDPYAGLKAAAKDPTKQIRVRGEPWEDFIGSGIGTWRLPPEDYEIRDKPKPKVKLWQWLYKSQCGRVYLTAYLSSETPVITAAEIIGPAFWTEIEL
jgi:hypothetical protein